MSDGIRWDVRPNLTPRGLLSELPASPYRKVIPAIPASQAELPDHTVARPSILRAGREYVAAPADRFAWQLVLACVAGAIFVLVLF